MSREYRPIDLERAALALAMLIERRVGKPCPTTEDIVGHTTIPHKRVWGFVEGLAARGLVELEEKGPAIQRLRRMRLFCGEWTGWTERKRRKRAISHATETEPMADETPSDPANDLKAQIQGLGKEALDRLAELMRGASSEQVQLAAARELLDRAQGRGPVTGKPYEQLIDESYREEPASEEPNSEERRGEEALQ